MLRSQQCIPNFFLVSALASDTDAFDNTTTLRPIRRQNQLQQGITIEALPQVMGDSEPVYVSPVKQHSQDEESQFQSLLEDFQNKLTVGTSTSQYAMPKRKGSLRKVDTQGVDYFSNSVPSQSNIASELLQSNCKPDLQLSQNESQSDSNFSDSSESGALDSDSSSQDQDESFAFHSKQVQQIPKQNHCLQKVDKSDLTALEHSPQISRNQSTSDKLQQESALVLNIQQYAPQNKQIMPIIADESKHKINLESQPQISTEQMKQYQTFTFYHQVYQKMNEREQKMHQPQTYFESKKSENLLKNQDFISSLYIQEKSSIQSNRSGQGIQKLPYQLLN